MLEEKMKVFLAEKSREAEANTTLLPGESIEVFEAERRISQKGNIVITCENHGHFYDEDKFDRYNYMNSYRISAVFSPNGNLIEVLPLWRHSHLFDDFPSYR